MDTLSTATNIARQAGRLLHEHFGEDHQINQVENHDIKLQMDLDCQQLIETGLLKAFPEHSIVGEEQSYGNLDSEFRWVVDPLDGTVNYTYGIPHYCVSIALQRRSQSSPLAIALGGYESVLGVIYDPMRDEFFSAEKGRGAFLNGQSIRVSQRSSLNEAIISVGFTKTEEGVEKGLRCYNSLTRRARKIRTMGSAALDLCYVAAGRMEMYFEYKVRLWDIAAGVLLVEEAGGFIEVQPCANDLYAFVTLASNGKANWKAIAEL